MVYGPTPTPRGGAILRHFEAFAARPLGKLTAPSQVEGQAQGDAGPPCRPEPTLAVGCPPDGPSGAGPTIDEREYAWLIEDLEEEIRQVREEYLIYRRSQIAITPALRESQLAPSAPEWTLLARQVNAVFRQIERIVKLLYALQVTEHGPHHRAGSPRLARGFRTGFPAFRGTWWQGDSQADPRRGETPMDSRLNRGDNQGRRDASSVAELLRRVDARAPNGNDLGQQ